MTYINTRCFMNNYDFDRFKIKMIENGINMSSLDSSIDVLSREFFELKSNECNNDMFCFTSNEIHESYNLFYADGKIKKLKFISPIIIYNRLSQYFNKSVNDLLLCNSDIDRELYKSLSEFNDLHVNNKIGNSEIVFKYFIGKVNLHFSGTYDIKKICATVNEWFSDKISKVIVENKSCDKITLINVDDVSKFFNEKCFKEYHNITIVNSKFNDNKIIELKNNKFEFSNKNDNNDDDDDDDDDTIFIDDKNQFIAEYKTNSLIKDGVKAINLTKNDNIFNDYLEYFKNNNDKKFIDFQRLIQMLSYITPKSIEYKNFSDININYLLNISDSNNEYLQNFLKTVGDDDYKMLVSSIIKNMTIVLNEEKINEFKKLHKLFIKIFSINLYEYSYIIMNQFINIMIIYLEKSDKYDYIIVYKFIKKYLLNNYICVQEYLFETTNETHKQFLIEYSTLITLNKEDYKLKEITHDLSKFLDLESNYILNYFSKHLYSQHSQNCKNIENNIINYILSKEDLDDYSIETIKSNTNIGFLMLTKLMYIIPRWHADSNKWIHNNIFTETLINFSQDIIDFYIKNHKYYNRSIYHRLMSLIAAKNGLMFRYYMDNNDKYDLKTILNKSLSEVLFILDNNYHVVNKASIIKGIAELSKIQNIYNYYKIPTSLEHIYTKELKKLINYCDNFEDSLDGKFDKIFGFTLNKSNSIDEVQVNENRFAPLFEIGIAFEYSFLYKGMARVMYEWENVSLTQQDLAINFCKDWQESWNNIDKIRQDRNFEDFKIKIINNTIGFGYIYDI